MKMLQVFFLLLLWVGRVPPMVPIRMWVPNPSGLKCQDFFLKGCCTKALLSRSFRVLLALC